ncbi:hypothetical protein ACGYLI_01535 [Sulfitobacter sp. 1A13421]|uniref:hypothetical protein n=1 Tax=Sulfitobacter sp. 1A13421 TaxID=3368595 RepID=UPI0037473D9A
MNLDVLDQLSADDDKKLRKALSAVAAVTIFVAGIELVSDEITLLGFSARIPQSKLLSGGQLVTLLLLISFIFRSLPTLYASISGIFRSAVKSKHERERIHLQLDWGHPDYPQFEDGPTGEFEELDYRQRISVKSLEERINIGTVVLKSISIIIIDYSIPLLVGIVALFAPEYPSNVFS